MRLLKFLLILFFVACNQTDNRTASTDNDDTANKEEIPGKQTKVQSITDVSGCYMQVLARDTFIARLNQDGSSISGNLIFDNYQKDGSRGEVKGRIEGDTIKLLYTFSSEGMNSVMEVYFKKEGTKLIRGVGEMYNVEDTVFFKRSLPVSYSNNTILNKIPCNKINQ